MGDPVKNRAPYIGAVVHFRVPKEGRPENSPRVAAAIVTGILNYATNTDPARVDLFVIPNKAGPYGIYGAPECDPMQPLEDCWHWPMQVGDVHRIAKSPSIITVLT